MVRATFFIRNLKFVTASLQEQNHGEIIALDSDKFFYPLSKIRDFERKITRISGHNSPKLFIGWKESNVYNCWNFHDLGSF
uniref:Uncharacterized protein n=1 Tax=Cucumis melo TaxID=3656 RepID=A0A9I9EE58_CUCME